FCLFFFSSRRRHTRSKRDWSSDVCSSDLHLQNLADGVPPLLEQLRVLQSSIPAKVALLKELRPKLEPPPGKDYPEQALIGHWEELRQKIPAATWDNYPSPEWSKLLAQTRGRSHDLLKLLQAQDVKEVSPPQKDFRQNFI